jgi:hypothetical protein
MKVKATAAMAKEIKKALTGIAEDVFIVKMDVDNYRHTVDFEPLYHENDYNYSTNKFQAIKIIYRPDFYAMPEYVTTNDLIKIFHDSDRTFEGFFKQIRNAYSI